MEPPQPPKDDPIPQRHNTAPSGTASTNAVTQEEDHQRMQSASTPSTQQRGSFWGYIPSIKFWETSAASRGKTAEKKEEHLRAQAEKEQARPPRFTPVWIKSGEPKKHSAGLTAFLNWIANQGYQVEDHAIVTTDGYILHVQRIHSSFMEDINLTTNPPKPKPVVFLQHGLMDCAATWVINGRRSIGFGLADRGFDVWLGNSRGTRFSVQHRDLRRSQAEFWAFDWDHMAKYDLPACFEYVQTVTKMPKITYIGHSQGTTIFFAAVSMNPAIQERINLYIAFCPVAYVKHQYSKMLTYVTMMKTDTILDAFGVKAFNTPAVFNHIFPGLSRLAPSGLNTGMVRMVMNAMVGFSEDNFDHQALRDWLTFMPGGTSVRNVLHWSQASRHGNFLAYDYGKEALNMKHYGTKTPPEYDPSTLTLPTVVFAGGADKLVHPNDLHRLMLKLKNVILVVEDEKYGHLDFLWGKNAKDKYHNVMYEVLTAHTDLPTHPPELPPSVQAKPEAPPVRALDEIEAKAEVKTETTKSKKKKHKHHLDKTKSKSLTDLREIHDSPEVRRPEQDRTQKLIATLDSDDMKESKYLHHRHPSNVHLLLQEIRRLREENEVVHQKYAKLQHATLSILNHMLEKNSPVYDEAFQEMKKLIPDLKEAHVRAVVLQDH